MKTSNIQSQMSPMRKTALLAGIVYLLTFVSIPTLALYNPLRDLNAAEAGGVIIGAMLETIVGLAGIGTAVILFPVLKKQNESLALGLVAARVLEAATIFVGVAFVLTAVALLQGGVSEHALISTLVLLYDRIFLVGQGLMPAVNDLLLGILLYQSGLVPKFLASIGIAGAFVLVAGDIGVLSGMLEQRAPITALFAIPVAVFEFSLGLLLVFKGFRTSGVAKINAD